MKKPLIQEKDFQRLFRLRGGILFLVSDIFGGYYKHLDCLLTGMNGVWTSYLPKKVVEKTLQEGLALFYDDVRFSQYIEDFTEYKKRATNYLDKVLKKNKLTHSEAKRAFALISEMFRFYSKTEFFYTDSVYIKLENHPTRQLRRAVEMFEDVKNSGRQFLNQLIFSGGYSDQLIALLARQFSVTVDQLKMYKVTEALNLFRKRKVSQTILKDRSTFIQYAKNGTMIYYEGEKARSMLKEFLADKDGFDREISGTIANKGLVHGRVKVIPTDYYSDFALLGKLIREMKKGDILVAETTSPELMPACKKAAAIVTDQGGLLSHAAIVSRELEIPCIVGTGSATEILKDGDSVEVDANKGFVRIVK